MNGGGGSSVTDFIRSVISMALWLAFGYMMFDNGTRAIAQVMGQKSVG